jgi:hypothetical protein
MSRNLAKRVISNARVYGLLLTFFLAMLLSLGLPVTSRAATPLYPDIKTLPPKDLRFGYAVIDGTTHTVLRFSNTSWNAGQGRLEMRGETVSDSRTKVYQRIYDNAGGFTEVYIGDFIFHPSHNHWHFENYADYELWTRTEYDKWIASGRVNGQAQKRGTKTTFCIMDNIKIQSLPGSPSSAVYTQCGQTLQGMSIGWGDIYDYSLPDQWIDLGSSTLPDGKYVLRSVTDPKNLIFESANNDPSRESVQANEAVTFFTVSRGKITLK